MEYILVLLDPIVNSDYHILLILGMGASYSGSIVKNGINWTYGLIREHWPIRGGPNKAMSRIKLKEELRQCEMGPISVRGQQYPWQHISEMNLSTLSSRTYFGTTSQLRVGHWIKDKNKKGRQISSKAATSALIVSQPTL